MDIRTLKLELLERIALLDDETRLLALKRLLDAPRGYGVPNENLSVVKEREEVYQRIEDRSYSAAEVRALLDGMRRRLEEERTEPASHFSKEEWNDMDREREQAARGESHFLTIDEVLQRMRKDLGE